MRVPILGWQLDRAIELAELDLLDAETVGEVPTGMDPAALAAAAAQAAVAATAAPAAAPAGPLPLFDPGAAGQAAVQAAVQAALAAAQRPAGDPVAEAIATGERNENHLTDLAFFARHPERGGARLQPSEKALAKEWLRLRDERVRPALRRAGAVPSAPTPGPASNAAVAERVADDTRTRYLAAGALGLVALIGIGVAAATS